MKNEKQNRREFLQTGAVGIAALSLIKNTEARETLPFEPHTELNETTIAELQAKMKSGELSAKKLAEK